MTRPSTSVRRAVAACPDSERLASIDRFTASMLKARADKPNKMRAPNPAAGRAR